MYTTVISNSNTPKWAAPHQNNLITVQQHKSPTDEHYSRHLEAVHNNDVSSCLNDEEPTNELENKNTEKGSDEEEVKVNNEEDEDDPKYDEPKIFQVEDVDLPSLITKPSSKQTSPLLNILKSENTFSFAKSSKMKVSVVSKAEQIPLTAEINLTSTMATPMHYFSRSSSMTSLNSFDVKSIHSEVASEYSQVTSQVTSPSYKTKQDAAEFNHSDYLDDLENLNMPDSPSAMENSFIMAQRYIHKQQQVIYRQNAAAAMGNVNCTVNNIQQLNKITFNSNQPKPWNIPKTTSTTVIQKSSQNSDLNLIMSRLNLKNASADNNKISESSDSDTASDSSDSLSFLNENSNNTPRNAVNTLKPNKPLNLITNSLSINHTPPIKLQANSTTSSKFSQSNLMSKINNTNETAVTITKPNSAPSMSVSYAFMKNSQSTNSQQNCIPQPQHQFVPKFLQTSKNQSYTNQFNSIPQQSSSSSSCSSSQNSVVNNNQAAVSPTYSDAPHVYMVEASNKALTPQAPSTRLIQYEDRPPSPQESICSRMSDSSIPSLIRQDISRTNVGFQQLKQQQQAASSPSHNNFKALFSKLNQQQNSSNNEHDKPPQYDCKPQNNLLPAFNFLRPQQNLFQQQQQQPQYFQNLNTPTNIASANNAACYDLDCTYSPKVFQNEGTNSRYSSASSLEKEEDDEEEGVEPIQNSTQIEAPIITNQDDDQDFLENFIKEMLPPVANSPPKAQRLRMASSMSSEAPFVNLTASKSRIRNSGSTSSLNSFPRPRTISATSYSKPEKPLKPIKPIQKITKKPTITQTKPTLTKPAPKKIEPKKPTTSVKAPVVNMTRTSQLRAKLATSNNNLNNTSISSSKPSTTNITRKPIGMNIKPRLKENVKDTPGSSVNSVHLNPHLDHLSRNGPRRNSFSFSTGSKIDKTKKDADTSISGTKTVTSAKPRSTWK